MKIRTVLQQDVDDTRISEVKQHEVIRHARSCSRGPRVLGVRSL